LRVKGKEPFVLDRSQAYIGVLIDDLVTKGTNEPYRMFTSRVEYRLLLREDNADLRLMESGYKLGLIKKEDYNKMLKKKKNIQQTIERLKQIKVLPTTKVNNGLRKLKIQPLSNITTFYDLLKRPGVDFDLLYGISIIDKRAEQALQLHMGDMGRSSQACFANLSFGRGKGEGGNNGLDKDEVHQVEIEIKYKGFIDRQLKEVDNFRKIENIKIPEGFKFRKIPGLSTEIIEKLSKVRPINLGQASRISGVTPVAISVLMVYIRKYRNQRTEDRKLKIDE